MATVAAVVSSANAQRTGRSVLRLFMRVARQKHVHHKAAASAR